MMFTYIDLGFLSYFHYFKMLANHDGDERIKILLHAVILISSIIYFPYIHTYLVYVNYVITGFVTWKNLINLCYKFFSHDIFGWV